MRKHLIQVEFYDKVVFYLAPLDIFSGYEVAFVCLVFYEIAFYISGV